MTIGVSINRLLQRENAHANPWFFVNISIAQALFKQHEELKDVSSSEAVSLGIKNCTESIMSFITRYLYELQLTARSSRALVTMPHKNDDYLDFLLYKITDSMRLSSTTRRDYAFLPDSNNIIKQVIALEYRARKNNNALLIRGDSTRESTIYFNHEKPSLPLINDGIYRKRITKKIRPYSIASAQSLFAGALFDLKACSYFFLLGGSINREFTVCCPLTSGDPIGFTLFIDKKNYVDNQSESLFFIPPLATLSALTQYGEYFHPRSRVALSIKNQSPIKVEGLSWKMRILDPTQILLIERNPWHHAGCMSDFVAKQGELIFYLDKTEQTALTETEIILNQAQAARFYKMNGVLQKFSALRKTHTRLKALLSTTTSSTTEQASEDEPATKRQKISSSAII